MKKNENKDVKEEVTESTEATETVDEAVEVDKSEERINELEARCAEATDKYLRIVAEYDNFRKRTLKERDSIYQDAYLDAVKQLLPVVDNVERALEYASDDGTKKGMELIIASVHQTLEKMGVKEIETKTFDPNIHNAVMHIEDDSIGEGEITEVFQKGYKKGDKIVRYAMVKVAN